MSEAKERRALTIHDEGQDAYRSAERGDYYVLNFVLSDMHGAYMPLIQSGPHASYESAWSRGMLDNVRTLRGKVSSLQGGDVITDVAQVIAARAFSVQNLTAEEVARFRAREQWLLEPMIVPQRDENGHISMRTMERPYA